MFFKVKRQAQGGIQTFLFFVLVAEEGDRQREKGDVKEIRKIM